ERGETLSEIALFYGVCVATLAEFNDIRRPDLILAGRTLRIPEPAAAQAQEAASPAPATPDRVQPAPAAGGMTPPPASDSAASRPQGIPDNQAVLETQLPVVVDGRRYASVAVRTTVSELIAISPAALSDALGPTIDEGTHVLLRSLGAELVPLDRLAASGVSARLDPQTLSVQVTVPPTARPALGVSLLPPGGYEGVERVYPGRVSAGVTGALLVNDNLDDDRNALGQFAFSGFANFGGITGLNADFGGSVSFGGEDDSFRRDAIILFKDDPQRATRYSAGDLSPFLPRLGGATGLLGVSYERSYEELDPTRNIRPTGRRSFFLERPAVVEVYANGVLLSRFQSQGGPVDLGDIPLANVSNNVTIVVEDALGRRELDAFSLSSDLTLLAPGLSEFSFSIGALRDDQSSGFDYGDAWAATAFYSRGVNDNLTVGAHAALSEEVANIGASTAVGFGAGVALVEFAASESAAAGNGFAASANFRGGPFLGPDRNDTLTASVDYTSADFATLADPFSTIDQEWLVAADYRFDISRRTSVSVGGSYATRHGRDGADKFVNLGLSQQFGPVIASVVGRHGQFADGREETGAFLSFSLPFGERGRASTSYDSISETARAEYVRNRGFEVPDFNYRLGAVDRGGETQLDGELGYTTTRFEADVGVSGQADGGSQAVRARLQSGIAFVDGMFGVSRDPGRGFYLFRPHPSLRGAEVTIESGAGSTTLARSGLFGPAVAPARNPYRPEELRVGVSGGPVGYDIGSGRYLVVPGARTGIGLTVGSDAYRTVIATLTFEGQPVSLLYGHLRDEAGVERPVFTNRAGRVAVPNLSPGRYSVVFPAVNAGFTFEVDDSDDAYRDAGSIVLERLP
ncbi:MAG: fimbria/pilus outer membrane usher protein, partial [Brevundimonas sp.]